MEYALLYEEFGEILYDNKNIFFLENFYNEVYEQLKIYIIKKQYTNMNIMIYRLYKIVKFLPKLNLIKKISSNIKRFSKIIDIIN